VDAAHVGRLGHGIVAAVLLTLALPVLSSCHGSAGGALEPPGGNQPPPESPPPPPPPPPGAPPFLGDEARVLFIGNSLTSANSLAAMVGDLARAAGSSWVVEAVTMGGASLEDHWRSGTAGQRLATQRWDCVVLQQGPSSLPESRTHIRRWTGVFDVPIRAAGGRSALYMVWPESNRLSAFDRVRDSYALAAADVNGRFLPAGETWREAWRRSPSAALYGPDGFHPTAAGTYAAALTIYAGLTGRSVVGLPAAPSVSPALALLLQESADRTVAAYRDYRPPDLP
jgi:hypothetical protein